MIDDYRNTKYCKSFDNVERNKKQLEEMILEARPRVIDMHNLVSKRESLYKKAFIEAYNSKCSYCGISSSLVLYSYFEVDHFIYRKSSNFHSKKDAGYMENLVLSCLDCNQKKSSFMIDQNYLDKLHPDKSGIKSVFFRDEKYYIKISEQYLRDECINMFYNALTLGSETRRLDYLLLNLIGLQKHSEDERICKNLGKIIDILRLRRNAEIR